MALAGAAVERARGDQDARARRARRRCPSRARRGWPRGRATPRSGRSGSRPTRAPPGASYDGRRSGRAARPRARRRRARRSSRAAAGRASSGRGSCAPPAARRPPPGRRRRTRSGSRRGWTAWTASAPRGCPSSEPPLTSGWSTETGLGLPGALEVALVGDQQRAALAAPVDDLAQVVERQHPAGRVGRASSPRPAPGCAARARSASRWRRSRRRPARRPPRRSGRPARGCTTRSPGPRPRCVGSPAISSLEPIDRQHAVEPEAGDAEAAGEPVDAGLPGLGQADRDAGSRASRWRRAAPAARPPASGRRACRSRGRRCRRDARAPSRRTASSWSQGKSGSRAETGVVGHGQSCGWGGSAAISGWSLSISPILAAPPGEPRSSKKCTLAS